MIMQQLIQPKHVSTTFMPNGAIYAGSFDETNGYPEAKLIGRVQKNKKGLTMSVTMITNSSAWTRLLSVNPTPTRCQS